MGILCPDIVQQTNKTVEAGMDFIDTTSTVFAKRLYDGLFGDARFFKQAGCFIHFEFHCNDKLGATRPCYSRHISVKKDDDYNKAVIDLANVIRKCIYEIVEDNQDEISSLFELYLIYSELVDDSGETSKLIEFKTNEIFCQ